MTVDIFCEVIDFYGDVAVAFRLARALKKRDNSWQIRFFCNQLAMIAQLHPHHQKDESCLIAVYPYTAVTSLTTCADVALEMLACTLPSGYPLPPLIINVDYFSAESWVTDTHLQPSLGMNPAGHKFFFMPGINEATGGLTIGDFLPAPANIITAKQTFLTQHNLPMLCAKRPWVSLYVYDLHEESLHAAAEAFILSPLPLTNSPHCLQMPMDQQTFDQLIHLSSLVLCRGEDSLSRALLSGKPFLWQAYRQENNDHLVKVEALIASALPFFSATAHLQWATDMRIFQATGAFTLAPWLKAGVDEGFKRWQHAIISLGSQENNLGQFIEGLL
jgi:hypothetical protein